MTLLGINQLKEKLSSGKDKKQTLLLAALVFLFILTAYFYVFLRPSVGRLMVLIRETSNLSMELKSARTDIDNRPQMEKSKTILQSKIDYYEKKLPSQKEIPKLLEHLSEIANQAGVKIVGIKPVDVAGEKRIEEDIYQETPINIDAKCGYHQLGRFIQELESADRFMKIDDIRIKADPSDMTRHNVKLIVITYTLTREK